jgi:hypothetical protein
MSQSRSCDNPLAGLSGAAAGAYIRSNADHGMARYSQYLRQHIFKSGAHMGEVIRFIPKAELERDRLIREARAMYEHVFPSVDQASARPAPKE